MKSAIKFTKPNCIKLLHKFIFDKSRENHANLSKFEGFKFKINDKDFETKSTEVLEKFNKIELVQIVNLLQTEIKETEKTIAHNVLLVLTDLDTFNSSFESYNEFESHINPLRNRNFL